MDDRRKILERFWDRIVCRDLDWPDEEIRRRVRVMRLGGLALSGFGLLFALEFLLIGQWLLGSVVVSAWFGLMFLWSMVRRGKHLRVLAHIMLAIMWSGVVFALWMTGGLSLANDVALFTIPPFALFMIGRSGVVWALASLGALLGMHALDAFGLSFSTVSGI
ncbi:MAG: hypothetical protein JRF33_09305 [Deltaproteobacteria bacterium]|nr:hypothetical protein [Deltaproteobacteria bacterium]